MLIIGLLYYFSNPYRNVSYEYDLKLGEISERDIIAPFEFPVFKSEATLDNEKDNAAKKVTPIYFVSDNLKFNAQKNLDFIFQQFQNSQLSVETVVSNLDKNGLHLSQESIEALQNKNTREFTYNYFTEKVSNIFDIGIYPDNFQYQKIRIFENSRVREVPLSNRYSIEEATTKLQENAPASIPEKLIHELSNITLIANIVLHRDRTNIERQHAKEDVPLTIGKVLKNEKIISKNQKVTAIDLLKIESLQKAQLEQGSNRTLLELFISAFGIALYSLILIILFIYFILIFHPEELNSLARVVLIMTCILGTVLITLLVNNIFHVSSILIPVMLPVIIIAIIFNAQIGVVFNFILFGFLSAFLNWSFINPIILLLTACGGLFAVPRIKQRQEYYPLIYYFMGAFLVSNLALTLTRINSFQVFMWHLLFGFISSLLSVIGLVVLIPIAEKKLNLATKQILLQLLDIDNPLLKKMSLIIPGTYHHSIIVGNLAESAAEAIGANHLLARVGSYYHDIGKLEHPECFIENNPGSTKIHDTMLANESAILIRNHINEGVSLAKKYKLPPQVRDILIQHHGTSQIRYFYNKALETNLDIVEEHFHYNGPKPQTREAAIVMIADIAESTTKSLKHVTEENIKSTLDDLVFRLIKEGQFDLCPLTIHELNTIKAYMHPILLGVYRKRLEYPEPK